MKIFERFSPLFLTNSFSNLFFLKSSKDLPKKIYEDPQKNEISRRSFVKIFVRSHSSEDLKKDLGPGISLEDTDRYSFVKIPSRKSNHRK
jgi:hypothetical protein